MFVRFGYIVAKLGGCTAAETAAAIATATKHHQAVFVEKTLW